MKALRGFPDLRIRWWDGGNPFKGHVVGKSKPPSFILGGAVSRGEIPINQVYLGLPFKASGCKIRRNVGVVTKCWFQPRFGSLPWPVPTLFPGLPEPLHPQLNPLGQHGR